MDGGATSRAHEAAHLHADRRRPVQPHLPRRGRRGTGLGPAPAPPAPRPAHRARHVPRVPAHALARAGGSPCPGDHRALHRRGGQRATLLRDGVRRGPHPAQRARGRGRVRRGDPAWRRRPHGRHAGRAARRRSRCRGLGRSGTARGLHRAPAQALARAVRPDAGRGRRPRWHRRAGERRAGPAHPQAAADVRRARGLPDGQRGARRRRDRPRHPRLGDLHAG